MLKSTIAAVFIAVAIMGGAPSAEAASDSLCLQCHDEKGAPFHASIHTALGCTGCHTDIKGFPHPDQVAKVKCGACHSDAAATLGTSVHAGASPQPCEGCHGDAHAITDVKDSKSPVYALNVPRTCGACHGDKKFIQEHRQPDVYAEYMDSVHAFVLVKDGLLSAATCVSCHGGHDVLDPRNPKSHASRLNVSATCGACHPGIQQEYAEGVHGKQVQAGNTKAPVCTDCHSAHRIINVRDVVFQMKTSATCGACHQGRYGTYSDTFHAQISGLGYVATAHCWDCHQSHNILPKSDPKSPVAAANLVATCGKCHSGANASFVTYAPHADPRNAKAYPALHASAVFMNVLLVGVLGFFALHTGLWFIRSLAERPHSRRKAP